MPRSNSYVNVHSHRKAQISCEFVIKNVLAKEVSILEIDTVSYFSIGLHPYHIYPEKNKDKKIQMVFKYANHPLVLAIGEIGIDRTIDVSIETQISVFKDQLEIAQLVNKPIIIHCVRAYSDILFLKKETRSNIPWIIHGFNANEKIARELVKSGCYLSFGPYLTKKESKAYKTFPSVPDKYCFLETDNATITIDFIYKFAADLKNTSVSKLKEQILENFNKVFTLN